MIKLCSVNKPIFKAFVTFSMFFAVVTALQAQVRLSGVFADHMVLQRNALVPVWGWAEPYEVITVEFAGQKKITKADTDGKWMVKLAAMAANAESCEMIVIGNHSNVKLEDILVGDVWLCSGQSNMEFPMQSLTGTKYEGDLKTANYPFIRQGFVPRRPSLEPTNNTGVKWQVCTPETIARFTAVGFYFAQNLEKELDVPIGLLFSAWGGTSAESWTSLPALETVPDLKIHAVEQIANLEKLPGQVASFPAAIADWEKANSRVDTENLGEKDGWQRADADTSGWQKFKINAKWRDAGLPDGGIAWIRKEVDLPAAGAGNGFWFDLGHMDGQYVTVYWNGVKLGETGKKAPEFYNAYVQLNVPPKLLKPGRNVFALRFVIDTPDNLPLNRHAIELGFLNLGLNNLSDDCLVKVERNFLPLTKSALAAHPAAPKGDAAHTSSALFGGMVRPLIPAAIKGVLWYQGEQDASRAFTYRTLLPLMIHDWRSRWGWDFPVLIQQLPNWNAGDAEGTQWAELREAQALTVAALTNCFISVAIDIGEPNNVHPKNKREVGRRLALTALANVYGKHLDYCGPVYDSMSVESSSIRLKFRFAAGLQSLDRRPLNNFAIAGSNRKFVPADAKINGETVVVSSPQVAMPVAVRYAFINDPENCNFSNASGLPTMPFRTDTWPAYTDINK